MNIDFLQQFCEKLPGVTSDIKWGHDLVFSICEKMFCICSTDPPFGVSFKVRDDAFEELSVREGFEPAPYLARAKWVLISKPDRLSRQEWESLVKGSYELVRAKLPKKMREGLDKAQETRPRAQEKKRVK